MSRLGSDSINHIHEDIMKMSLLNHTITSNLFPELRDILNKFQFVFYNYTNNNWINCKDLILSDKYYELKNQHDNIIEEIKNMSNDYNDYINEKKYKQDEHICKEIEKERIECIRNIKFPYTITFLNYKDYNVYQNIIQPITCSLLNELGKVNNYGEAFDLLGIESEYPDSIILEFSIIDNENKKIIVLWMK